LVLAQNEAQATMFKIAVRCFLSMKKSVLMRVIRFRRIN